MHALIYTILVDGAKILGITRHMLSRVIKGQAGISPEMAVRLEKLLGEQRKSWLALKQAYELAQVERGKSKFARGLQSVKKPSFRKSVLWCSNEPPNPGKIDGCPCLRRLRISVGIFVAMVLAGEFQENNILRRS
jgi:addiction module HigA family antidote